MCTSVSGHHQVVALSLIVSLLLAACGGSSNRSSVPESQPHPQPTPAPQGLSISGRLLVPQVAVVDSDTADAGRESDSNDQDPQRVEGERATIAGFARTNADLDLDDPTTDLFDNYLLTLQPGQVVNLFIAGDGTENDLDLFLFEEDAEAGDFASVSVAIGKFETVIAPADAEGPQRYRVQVFAFSGSSNYVLTTGPETVGFVEPTPIVVGQRLAFVPGQLIVQMKQTAPDDGAASAQAKTLGAATLASIPDGPQLMDVSLRAKSDTGSVFAGNGEQARALETLYTLKALRRRPDVQYAELNRIARPLAIPDDPLFAQQAWHYNLINLPQAWDLTQGSEDVLVAVLDSGVRLDHPDIAARLDPNDPDGYDFVTDPSTAGDGDGPDGNADSGIDAPSHGTHVAGTIAADTNNGTGGAGVGWQTRIMPLRVLGLGGAGSIASTFDIYNALLYAAGLPNSSGELPTRPADIANLSLGFASDLTDSGFDPQGERADRTLLGGPSFFEVRILEQVRDAGLIVIAAAGNDGNRYHFFPASHDGVISVAALDPMATRTAYSNFAGTIDVSAPGGGLLGTPEQQVISTDVEALEDGTIRAVYTGSQGTSMASPHVAGVVALMKAIYPGLTPEILDQVLASGAITRDLGPPGKDWEYGHGTIDAHLAVMESQRLADGGQPGPALETPNLVVQFPFAQNRNEELREVDGPRPLRAVLAGPDPELALIRVEFPDADISEVETRVLFIYNGGQGALATPVISVDVPWVNLIEPFEIDTGIWNVFLELDFAAFVDGGGDLLVGETFTLSVVTDNDRLDTEVTVRGAEGISTQPDVPETSRDIGPLTLHLLSSEQAVVSEIRVSPNSDGFYDFSFENLNPGSYGLVAGTDNDGDSRLCDAGEACAVFPLQDSPAVINVRDRPQRDLLFRLGFNTAVAAD